MLKKLLCNDDSIKRRLSATTCDLSRLPKKVRGAEVAFCMQASLAVSRPRKELGTDEDGDPITAGFCEEMTEGGERSGPRLPPQQRKLMVLFQSLAGRGETVEREA